MKFRKLYSPFNSPNHCVPLAFACVSGGDPLALAQVASQTKRDVGLLSFKVLPRKATLLYGDGAGAAYADPDAKGWARLAGITLGEPLYLYRPRPTLAQFVQAHPRGRWLVYVQGGRHILAVVNGVVRDQSRGARRRVSRAYEVVQW